MPKIAQLRLSRNTTWSAIDCNKIAVYTVEWQHAAVCCGAV